MRRAQSVRHYARPSLVLGADDLGVLKEGDESTEDVLRRQLLEKDRENDKLQTQIQTLQGLLAQRPPIERLQELEREYKNVDILLQGTLRDNERCAAEIDRGKAREKLLEQKIAKLAGESWQTTLEIAPSTTSNFSTRSGLSGTPRSAFSPTPSEHQGGKDTPQPSTDATIAHTEQTRLLILGMEQRLQAREEKLAKTIERAEKEGEKFEGMRKVLA